MSDLTLVSEARSFNGWQRTFEHSSSSNDCKMRFAVYLPPAAERGRVPAVYWLSGLTCTEENFSVKSGGQHWASELGLALVIPDTSPPALGIEGENEDMDLGIGAGFYVNATQDPWAAHYQMYDYVANELVEVANQHFPLDPHRKSISGHSMGGHGAITVGLKNPGEYRSISAFAPICSASRSAWGAKALSHYVGPHHESWQEYDAAWLAEHRPSGHELLVDQGAEDPFLSQLRPGDLEAACEASGQALRLQMREGYDHSYFFVASFLQEHLQFHARHLSE